MNRNQRKLLKDLSNDIDDIFIKEKGDKLQYVTIHNRKVSNEDMVLANQNPEEGQSYTMKIPHMHHVNHFRRLKRSFIKNGSDGVVRYLKTCGFTLNESIIHQGLSV